MEEREKCCICGVDIEGYGFNPYPIKREGRCCRQCNLHLVIPERVRRFYEEKEEEE